MAKKSKKQKSKETSSDYLQKEAKFKARLERVCLFVIQYGVYLALFTPLIVARRFYFPFVVPKTIFFRVIVDVILLFYVILALYYPRYRPKMNLLTIGILIFLGILILTSFTGVNLERSFWSTFERMTGLLTFFHLFAFFVILSSVFKERRDWEKIFAVSVAVGVFLSLYILLSDQISSRGGGTIGNTSFMAAYLLFDIFFGIILFLTKNIKWRIFSGISLIVMIPTLLTSTGRGAIISFFGGLFLLILSYMFLSGRKILQRSALALVLFLIILASIFIIAQPVFLKNKGIALLGELKPRIVVWNIALKGWLEKFWLGWGPENFNIVFGKYFDPRLFLSEYGGEVWFDRAHNIILDTGATSGLIGLISYLSIFVIAIFSLFKICWKVMEKRNIFLPLGTAVLLIVYFVQNLLVFDMISTYVMFFLSLAFVSFLTKKNEMPESTEEPKKIMFSHQVLAGILIVITIFTFYFGNIRPAQASYFTGEGVGLPFSKKTGSFFQKALAVSPMAKWETSEQFVRVVSSASFDPKNKEILFSQFDSAEKYIKKAVEQDPLNYRLFLFLGRFYFSFFRFSEDPQKLDSAEENLKKAIELCPANQQGYWHLAEVKFAKQEKESAIKLLNKAIELEPRLGKSHWFLAIAYKFIGQYGLAKQKVIDAEKAGFNYKRNLDNLKVVIDIYNKLGEKASVLVPLYLRAIELQPRNAHFWISLAGCYAELKEYEKAKEAIMKAKEIDVNLAPQVEEFLEKLPSK